MKIEIYESFDGTWKLAIIATSNGNVMAESTHGYKRKRNAVEAAQRLKKQMGRAKIEVQD